ncbi:unnamed protein product [Dracunculus medinensis]|uniref:5'-AMP-activated protein kinase subunit gamma-1 n=1 Tax=Dracunculus medinensis TaxID=318479 RepID=A0A0N4UG06_DRAME|nr:unnamed protein product [Dracunculus medinensis]
MFAAKGSLRKALHKRHTAHESKAQHKNQTDDDSKPTTTKHKDKTLLSFVRREGKLIRKTFGEICGAETVLQDATQPKSGQLKARSRLQSESQNAVYALFMKAHKCYDLIPTSSKLVVFDTELPIKKAFFALIYNGVRAAPLWNSKKQEFVGMLTVTDFIQILYNDCKSDGIKELEEQKIEKWREIFEANGNLQSMVTVEPSESLYRAVQLLCDLKIHRLPIMESGASNNIWYILTHKRIIKFLYIYLVDLPRPSYMDKTPKDLGIGTWGNIFTITKSTSVIDALRLFLERRVSALPLIDKNGKVIDIYAKFDVINLAAEKAYNDLDITVYEALQHRSEWFEGVRSCLETDSLMVVIEILVKTEIHRLIVVDSEQRAIGIISLSDILRFLIIEPPAAEDSGKNIGPKGLFLKRNHLETGKSDSPLTKGMECDE